ncbi:MAG: phosphotransferase enzyme family protein, partial [Acutalibacteraceae bacterium]
RSILPALTFNGKKMQKINGQYFYLFDYYEGKSLKDEEITIEHCRKIGEFLAKIHSIEKQTLPYNRSEINVDWDTLIEILSTNNSELYSLLSANRDILYESQQKGNAAIKRVPPVLTICHNDMDSKNVLWSGDGCRIIDLECLCWSSPFIELYEMALCWSGYEKCNIDFNLFKALIQSYADNGGELSDDWETIYYSSYGRLEWLEYNVKRALGIDCGKDEIEIGVSEVRETMEHIIYYNGIKDKILENLHK